MTIQEKYQFGDYTFPDFVPIETQKEIISFWGIWGRNKFEWLRNHESQERKFCYHIPCSGFGFPKMYQECFFFVEITGEFKNEEIVYKRIRGRFVFKWNNIGCLIDDKGKSHPVSSCDIWTPILKKEEIK